MSRFSFLRSIKTQLIVLLFGLTALSIGIVGFLGVRAVEDSGNKAQVITSDATNKRASELLGQTVTATADKNSLLFKNVQRQVNNIDTYIEQVFDNPGTFTTAWRFDDHVHRQPTGQYWNAASEPANILLGNFVGTPSAAIKKNIELLHNLDFIAPQTLDSNSDAVALYFIGQLGESFYYPNIDLGNIIPPDLNPNTLDFYTIAEPDVNPSREVKWTKVYDDPAGNGLTITASSPVYKNKDSFIGVASMDITLGNIAKNIEDYSPIQSSYAFLVDNDGRAVAMPAQGYRDILGREQKQKEFGPDLQKAAGDFGPVLRQMRQGKSGFQSVLSNSSKKDDLYIAYAPISGTNFSLGLVAKEEVMLKVVGDLRAQVQKSTSQVLYFQILPFAAGILALVWVLGFLYIRYITGPIIALTRQTNSITSGGPNQEINLRAPNNEVGKLTESFNRMTRELTASYQALQNKVLELGQAKAKDDAILRSIGDGLVVVDPEGRILLLNAIAAKLLNLQEGRAGQQLDDYELYSPDGQTIPHGERPLRLALTTGQRVVRDVMAVGRDQKKVALSVTATPVTEQGKTIGAIQTIRDVTKEKEVDRLKTEFISVASHQLRTPLSAIKWFAELLLHGDAGKMQPEQEEFIKNMYASTNRMVDLVNSLLNVSRLESGRILVDPVPVHIKDLVDGAINDLQSRTVNHEQTLTINVEPDLPIIKLDRRLISQVYLNLISNAIKYTPKGGAVTITVSRKGDQIISEIKDTGYGVPAAEQKKMFTKFFRGTNILPVETDGTGLGMYLAKSIVESSGGKIWFESTEGKGTTFWFSLPIEGMKPHAGEVTLD